MYVYVCGPKKDTGHTSSYKESLIIGTPIKAHWFSIEEHPEPLPKDNVEKLYRSGKILQDVCRVAVCVRSCLPRKHIQRLLFSVASRDSRGENILARRRVTSSLSSVSVLCSIHNTHTVQCFPPGLRRRGGGGGGGHLVPCTYTASLYYYHVLREHGENRGAAPPSPLCGKHCSSRDKDIS